MELLAVDIGTYSLKFYLFRRQRKGIQLKEAHEVILDQHTSSSEKRGPEVNDGQADRAAFKRPLHQVGQDTWDKIEFFLEQWKVRPKMTFQLPVQMMTTRYLMLPVSQEKKAEQMIPFQLDEELPFGVQDTHFTMGFSKMGKALKSLTAATQVEEFSLFHEELTRRNLIPQTLSAEVFYIQSFLNAQAKNSQLMNDISGPAAIIDFGHESTKAYLFNGKNIFANYHSHIAGKQLSDVISETYQVSWEEAQEYKHENAFVLPKSFKGDVGTEQQEFAELMDRALEPLVTQIQKWLLGARIHHHGPIQKVFIIGGTSKLRNLPEYLQYELGVEVVSLSPYTPNDQIRPIESSEDRAKTFQMAHIMGSTFGTKEGLPNFLRGIFKGKSLASPPFASLAFFTWRSTLVSSVLCISFFINLVLLQNKEKTLDREIVKLLKIPELDLSKRDQRTFRNSPGRIYNIIHKKNKMLKGQKVELSKAESVNIIDPVNELIGSIGPLKNKGHLSKLKISDSGEFTSSWKFSSPEALTRVKAILEESEWPNKSIKSGPLSLTLNFSLEDDDE